MFSNKVFRDVNTSSKTHTHPIQIFLVSYPTEFCEPLEEVEEEGNDFQGVADGV